jgi:hypothetical protein
VFVVRSFHETSRQELADFGSFLASRRFFSDTESDTESTHTMVLRRLALGFGIALIGS